MNTKTIHFKSWPANYEKEKDGRKPNTLRSANSWIEHGGPECIDKELNPSEYPEMIIIENSETGEFFTRMITDITEFEGWVIISWRHEG